MNTIRKSYSEYIFLCVLFFVSVFANGQSNKKYRLLSELEYPNYVYPPEEVPSDVLIYSRNSSKIYDSIKALVVYPIVSSESSFRLDSLFPNLELLYIHTNCKFLELGRLNKKLKYFGFGIDWEEESGFCNCNMNYEWFPYQILALKNIQELYIYNEAVFYIPEQISKLRHIKKYAIISNTLSFPVSPLIKRKAYPEIYLNVLYDFHLKENGKYIPITDQWRYNLKKELIHLPVNGIFKNYWSEKKNLLVEGYFKNRKPDGKWTFWYENGQLWNIRNYNKGMETGVWIYFADNGDTVMVEKFNNGIPWYRCIYSYEDNNWDLQKKIMLDTSTSVNGTINAYERGLGVIETFKDNYRKITYFNKDTILGYKVSIDDGNEVKERYQGTIYTWYENGKLKELINYANNKKNGERILFNESGKIIRKEWYKEDELIEFIRILN